MSENETYIRFTFPPAPLREQELTSETVRAEFGPISFNHLELAILLMADHATKLSGDDTRELFADELEELALKVRRSKGKTALEVLFQE